MQASATQLLSLTQKNNPFCHLWDEHRYKVYYGGRGSGKSWAVAFALVMLSASAPLRILCCREIQNSIRDSSYQVIKDTAERLGIAKDFEFLEAEIKHVKTGSRFIFKGLLRNEQSVKSTEGIDICWIEEAQTVSETSLKVLIPTIRKDGSEIWLTFNPLTIDSPVYERFILNPPDNAYVRKVNYDENPYLPETLREEMEYLKRVDYDAYLHVWEGEPLTHSDAQIFKGKWTVEPFADDLYKSADRLFFGADFGYAKDASTLVRCFMLNGNLYIDYEAYGVGVDLDEMGQLYATVPEASKWEIIADCARPETIAHVKRKFGYRMRPSPKWTGSIEDGIAFIRSFEKVIIHPRCKHVADEFKLYSYKVDKLTEEVLPIIVDANNHCIDAIRYALSDYIKNKDISQWMRISTRLR